MQCFSGFVFGYQKRGKQIFFIGNGGGVNIDMELFSIRMSRFGFTADGECYFKNKMESSKQIKPKKKNKHFVSRSYERIW